MQRTAPLFAVAIALVVAAPASAAVQATALTPALYDNCTALHKKYAHGLGKVGARDKTKSGNPVTTFKRSNTLYKTAMRINSDLDRDNDGVACEKK
jgi:hypothetical protein